MDTHVDLILPWEPSRFVGFVMPGSVMVKTVLISRPITFEPTGAVAQLLEGPACVREVVGSISVRVIPKTFRMVLAALSFALGIEKAELVYSKVMILTNSALLMYGYSNGGESHSRPNRQWQLRMTNRFCN